MLPVTNEKLPNICLYFNCKIVNDPLTPSVKLGERYNCFVPVTYPRHSTETWFNSHEVLIKSIRSLAKFSFRVAIFNIEYENPDATSLAELKQAISESCTADKLIFSENRPSTLADWKSNIKYARELFPEDAPVLVVMNHDHPFCDSEVIHFYDIVNLVFQSNQSNFGRVLYYSHAPESISIAMNGRWALNFRANENFLFLCSSKVQWIDSISVMTMDTLEYIFNSIKTEHNYIGRFDWVGVKFRPLQLSQYIYPREFFRHFDGYGHATSLTHYVDNERYFEGDKLAFFSDVECVAYYRKHWEGCFLLGVSESLFKRRKFTLKYTIKKHLVASIEESFQLFFVAYIKRDLMHLNFSDDRMNKILQLLREEVYFDLNKLAGDIFTDLQLNEIHFLARVKHSIRLVIWRVFKIWL